MITGADQKKAMRNIAAFLVEYIMTTLAITYLWNTNMITRSEGIMLAVQLSNSNSVSVLKGSIIKGDYHE